VASQLAALGVSVELVPISTRGDVTTGALGSVGGQGLFTKEIQGALLEGDVDLAVHSLKDLPTDPVAGIQLAAVPQRASIYDAMVCGVADSLDSLPDGACVGTGSARRRAQLLHARPDLAVVDIRGNVDTRLRKLDDGQYDAILLAEAGLRRLGLEDRITALLPISAMLPAVGQGALGIEARSDDTETLQTLGHLNHVDSRSAVAAERHLLAALRAGCLAPVGAWGRVEAERLVLDAVVLSLDGRSRLNVTVSVSADDPTAAGQAAAQDLLSQGAAALIAGARNP
jgi:hydroxymethylbilane synthase